jgi:hypothetical protein
MDQTPALRRLVDALNAFQQPAWCEGATTAPALAIGVSGETVTAADGEALVGWLTKRSEAAPFGHKGKTKKDQKVRSTLRVKVRDRAVISGLDLGAIVERIEDALGTTSHITATLLDVLVYPVGGKFLRHKDTPRSGDQLGTLIVEVPVAHEGGKLTLTDGRATKDIAWSGAAKDPSKLRWVAMFGDVDHQIAEVKAGARVTLVYTLALSDKPRTDATFRAHLDTIADAAIALIGDDATLPKGGELYIPCEHMIVAPAEAKAPYPFEVLRGSDRAIAEVLARCGLATTVRELLIPSETAGNGFPQVDFAMRLAKPIPDKVFEDAGATLSFVDDPGGEYIDEGEGDVDIASIADYLDKHWIDYEKHAWLVRTGAKAKQVYEGLYSVTGYFGNECDEGHIYQCGALVVDLQPYAKRMGKAAKSAAKPAKPAAKKPAKKPAAKKPAAKKPAKSAKPAKKSAKKPSAKKR